MMELRLAQRKLRASDDQRHPQGHLKVAVLGPLGVLAQGPAMITEYHHHRVLQIQASHQLAKEIVHIGHGGVVALPDLSGLMPRDGSIWKGDIRVFKVIPSTHIRVGIPGHRWHVRWLQAVLGVVEELRQREPGEELPGKAEVDVRLVEAHGQEEGLSMPGLATLHKAQSLRHGLNVRQGLVRLRLQLHRADEVLPQNALLIRTHG